MLKFVCSVIAAILAVAFGCPKYWPGNYEDPTQETTAPTETTAYITTEVPTTEAPATETTAEPTTATTSVTEDPTEPTGASTEASTEATTAATTDATEPETKATTEASEPTTEETTEATEETTEVTEPVTEYHDPLEAKYLHYVDMPVCNADASAKESDFAGYWVVDVMAKNHTAYDTICGVPVFATGHLEITAHNPAFDALGSGKFINIKPLIISNTQQGGPPAAMGPGGAYAGNNNMQQQTEAEETELPMTYSFEDGVLKASVTIPVGPSKNQQTPDFMKNIGQSDPTLPGPPPKQMALQMTDDGRILVQSTGADGVVTSAYYKRVDQFEAFDWESVQFDYASVLNAE